MSHSAAQQRKKAEAMKEAIDHHKHATVDGMRSGRDHEAHKVGDIKRDDRDRGEIANSGGVGDMGSSDKFSMGY